MRFAECMAVLTEEQRLHFYEVLTHNLTGAIRDGLVLRWSIGPRKHETIEYTYFSQDGAPS